MAKLPMRADQRDEAMDETERLIESYIDNELAEVDGQSLSDWLRADRAHVDHFVRACFVHWQLSAICQRRALQTDVEALRRHSSGLRRVRQVLLERLPRQTNPFDRTTFRVGRRIFAAAAVSLLVICTLVIWWAIRTSRPATVAQLTRASADAAWDLRQSSPAAGMFFHEGQRIRLTRGRILATLSTGVRVVIQSPAALRLKAGNSLLLQSGRITVIVPRQASGFIVETPLARFVDLGTEFTINIKDESSCELHVFSGLVEMQPQGVRRTDRLRVPEGRAVEYNPVDGSIERLPFVVEERLSL